MQLNQSPAIKKYLHGIYFFRCYKDDELPFLGLIHDDPDLKRCNEEFPFAQVKQLPAH